MPSSYTIGGHFENFIKEQVEGGSYASASEVIRDGLRILEEDQKRRQAVIDGLRGEIEKGRSGKPKPAAEVLDRRERKYIRTRVGGLCDIEAPIADLAALFNNT
jgi:antitoxin ParD1/3/4